MISDFSKNRLINIINQTGTNKIDISEKGANNGVCELNASGLIPINRINPNFLEFQGTWDAFINSPYLVNGANELNTGNLYIISVSGTQFGINFLVGDFTIFDGFNWKKVDGLTSGTFLKMSSNLSDLTNITTARTNLNIYSKTEADTLLNGKVSSISNTDGNIIISNTNPLIPVIDMETYFRWGNGAHRGLLYQFYANNVQNGAQCAVNATLTASISNFNVGWLPVNRGHDADLISSTKSLWTLVKDNLPQKVRLVDVTNDASYVTLMLNSFNGTGSADYLFNCNYVSAETTMTNIVANYSFLYVMLDFSNKTYINAQDTILQTQITTNTNNKIDTVTNTDTNLTITGTGASRNININNIQATKGGTGIASYAVGDILTANTTTTLSKVADIATGNALISGGVGVIPSYGKIELTGANQHVNGILQIANGGTSATDLNNARINLAFSRNVLKACQLRIMKNASNFSVAPNWENLGNNQNLGLGHSGTASFDNLVVIKLPFPVNLTGQFYPEVSGVGYKNKWFQAFYFSSTADLNNLIIGMASEIYLQKPQDYATTATSLAEGTNDTAGMSYKFGIRFNGATAERLFNDGFPGTSTGVTRYGYVTNSTGQGLTILILSQESPTTLGIHWYNVSGTTLNYVSHAIIPLPYSNQYQSNIAYNSYHPCFTTQSQVITLPCERFMTSSYTTINNGATGIFSYASYYNLVY